MQLMFQLFKVAEGCGASAPDLHFFSSTLNSTVTGPGRALVGRCADGSVSCCSPLFPSCAEDDIRELVRAYKASIFVCCLRPEMDLLEVQNSSLVSL